MGKTCKFKVPETTSGLLTFTDKMPGASWSTPAKRACPGALFDLGSICASCYARKGNYTRWNAIQIAQERRFQWTLQCLKTIDGTETWVNTMVTAITFYTRNDPFFRVHDSGDLFSPKYTRAWIEVCRRLPNVNFWFPTRSYRLPWVDIIRELAALPNVTIRPSALYFEDPAPIIDGLHAGTTATATSGFTCPAPLQGNKCADCRACWLFKTTEVSYHKH